jgi:hypothetical protein
VIATFVAPWLWLAWPAMPAGTAQASRTGERPAGGVSPLTGTAGCSARACHGGIRPIADQGVRQVEYTRWLARDKHADAYRVLTDSSQVIVQHFLQNGKRAHEEPTCLACHTNPLAAGSAPSPWQREERLSGVGCEACHGAARAWLGPHTGQEWKNYSAAKKHDPYGMMPVGDPVALAQTCAGCHVGAPADPLRGLPLRDVNHDLIAMGHPRLQFEFGAFLANLPPHWNEETRKRDSCFEAKVWAVGQVVSAEAALNLLADRAADTSRPWPEFAEYSCFACHHDLSEPSWRQQRGYGGRTPGALPWGRWYYAMPRLLATEAPFGDSGGRSLLDGLDKLGDALRAPLRGRDHLPVQARDLAKQLRALRDRAAGEGCSPEAMRKLLTSFAREDRQSQSGARADWDAVEQLYLAATALSQVHGDERSRKALQELARKRAHPSGFDSPRGFRPDEFLEELREGLRHLRE